MTDALERLQSWLDTKEGENFEFKEAKNSYNFSDLLKYCSALSNEGGGRILLGITNKRPRRVVGSQAFSQPEDTRRSLMEKLRINVDFEVIRHPNGRVLAFSTPSHPIGLPVQAEGIAWMRSGDMLVPLSEERRREIYEEAGHDFSADICPNAAFSDLNPQNIEIFRRRWIAKSANPSLNGLMPEQLLRDAEAIIDGGITYVSWKRSRRKRMFRSQPRIS
jgi:ATP-dependent DNA helicase RecG